MDIHQKSSPLGDHKYRGDPLSYREQNKWGKQIEFSAEGNQFGKKYQKWELMKCSVTVKTATDQ